LRQADRTRVVHQDIDTAEALDGGPHRGRIADVGRHGERRAAGCLDLGTRRVQSSRELGVRRGGLGEQHDVRAVACRAHGDRQSDAT
jgi:hypothetical protein